VNGCESKLDAPVAGLVSPWRHGNKGSIQIFEIIFKRHFHPFLLAKAHIESIVGGVPIFQGAIANIRLRQHLCEVIG